MIKRVVFGAIVFLVASSADVPETQFKRGLLWEDNRYNALPVTYPSSVSMPPSKSLKEYFPKVIIESAQDFSGVAWSAVWNARTAAEAIACNQKDPGAILRFAFSPAYNYGLVRKGNDCKESISLIDILESMTKNGTPHFSEFREFCATAITPDLYPVAKTKKLSGYIKLFNTSDPREVKIQSIKNALVNNHAVVVGMICPPSFQLAQDFWQPREQPEVQHGGHALSVVGYDDTKFGGAFEVVNTWGKDWGTAGYTWLRYKDFADFVPYAFSLFQVGSAACNSPLVGGVSFKNSTSGKDLPVLKEVGEGEYRIEETLATGTSLLITANINRPVYFYSYFLDPKDESFVAFPRNSGTPPILFDQVRIPEGLDVITLAEPAGLNQLFFVFSPEKIDPMSLAGSHRGASVAFNTGVTWMKDSPGFSSTMKTPVVIKVYLNQK